MERKIFFKEFIGKKSTRVLLIVAFLFINIILAFATNNLLSQFDGSKKPDVVIYGKANHELVYTDIADEIDYFIENDRNNDFEIIPCKAVQCLEVAQSPMKKANIYSSYRFCCYRDYKRSFHIIKQIYRCILWI